jgi:hypothetical protein
MAFSGAFDQAESLQLVLHSPGPQCYCAKGMATVACYYLGNVRRPNWCFCTFNKICSYIFHDNMSVNTINDGFLSHAWDY